MNNGSLASLNCAPTMIPYGRLRVHRKRMLLRICYWMELQRKSKTSNFSPMMCIATVSPLTFPQKVQNIETRTIAYWLLVLLREVPATTLKPANLTMGKHPHLRIDPSYRPEIVEAGLDYEVSEDGKISTASRRELIAIVEAGLDYEVGEDGEISTTSRPELSPSRRPKFIVESPEIDNPHTKRQLLCGVTVASGLGGCLLGGPVGGTFAASGAALAVSSRSKIGEIARSSGDAAARVGDKIIEINEKHRVVDTVIDKTVEGFDWVSRRLRTQNSHHAK
jgi:hypothetical protein